MIQYRLFSSPTRTLTAQVARRNPAPVVEEWIGRSGPARDTATRRRPTLCWAVARLSGRTPSFLKLQGEWAARHTRKCGRAARRLMKRLALRGQKSQIMQDSCRRFRRAILRGGEVFHLPDCIERRLPVYFSYLVFRQRPANLLTGCAERRTFFLISDLRKPGA